MITFPIVVFCILITRVFYDFYLFWKYEPIRYNAEDAKHQPRSYRR